MQFNNSTPIYLQIAEQLESDILSGRYPEEERIPSVRELSASLEVNVNTVMKAYDRLTAGEIIYNRRGMGYYVKPGATEKIRQERRRHFFDTVIPHLHEQMRQLGITYVEMKRVIDSVKDT